MSISNAKKIAKKDKKILKYLLTNRFASVILTKLSRKMRENMAE